LGQKWLDRPPTRAIRIDVETPDQINEVFDGIADEKTAGVLRMIEAVAGADAFRKGISSYLTKFSHGNAAGEDFWTEMARGTGRPIDRIMRSYVGQPGVPVLSVQTRCTGSTTDITLAQQRFVGTPGASAPAAQTWAMPACFKANDGQPRCEVLDGPTQTLSAPGCANVFANADGRGYFTECARHRPRTLARVEGRLQPVERLSLLGDEWWMVRDDTTSGVFLDPASLAGDDGGGHRCDSRGSRCRRVSVAPAQAGPIQE
jgi:aminopeptidase N